MNARTPSALPPCPRCGSAQAARVVYGLPGPELLEAWQRSEVRLGGCVVGEESPDYECRSCDAPLPWVAADDP